jgi:hypothetical protein
MKKLSFEKILAENMLRFGTKNLGSTVNKLKRLIEGLGAGDGVGAGVAIPADALALIQSVGPTCTAYKNAVQQTNAMKIPVLCNGSIIDAIIYGAIKGNAAQLGTGGLLKLLGMKKSFAQKLKKILDGLPEDSLKFADASTISFNPYPEDPTKVATLGEVTAAMGRGGDQQAGSDYMELLKYLNTYNLLNCINTPWVSEGVQQYVLGDSYAGNDDNGFLDLDAGPALYAYGDICFYATAAAGVSKAGKTVTKSKFIPQAGPVQDIPIGPDTFPAMKVAVADAGWTKISDQIDGFTTSPEFGGKGWKITAFTVNTAASLGETVKSATAASFATEAGVQLSDVTAAGITDSNVKDISQKSPLVAGPAKAGRSGQDFLAITRANNIKARLESAYPGIPVTTAPVLALGKASGRYGSVTFTVSGPNKELSIPATMVNTGTASAAKDLSKLFNAYRIDSEYPLVSMFKYTDEFETGTSGQ